MRQPFVGLANVTEILLVFEILTTTHQNLNGEEKQDSYEEKVTELT